MQFGAEATLAAYLGALCAVVDEVVCVLRADSAVWINVADRYLGPRPLRT